MRTLEGMLAQESRLILYSLTFQKAFDKVNHNKILWKLHQYGIRGKVLSWIQAFLGNRSQWVVIDGGGGGGIKLHTGELRYSPGLSLVPILFVAYMNDLPDEISSQVRLFADDIRLFILQDSSALQKDLDTLSVWELNGICTSTLQNASGYM